MTRRMVIVGNGPLAFDICERVDSADYVLRFNEPKASVGMSGVKTDLLLVNNSGKPMERRLRNPDYVRSPIVKAAREVAFAYHPDIIRSYLISPTILSRLKGRRADWTFKALEMFGRAGKEVRIMPPAFYTEGCDELGIPETARRTVFPSTGYLGIRYLLQRTQQNDWSIEVCGFTWKGWKRHAWGDERAWIREKVAAGRITMLAVPDDVSDTPEHI